MHNTERGRSMAEMIIILAIMAVLTIVAVLGLSYATGKTKANNIVNDANILYMAELPSTAKHTQWQENSSFTPRSGYKFQTKFDSAGQLYIKIDPVSKDICEHILRMKNGRMSVYTNEGEELVECMDSANLILVFDGNGVEPQEPTGNDEPEPAPEPERECETSADCADADTYCTAEGECDACPNGTTLNADRTGCVECTTSEDCADETTYCTPEGECQPCEGGSELNEDRTGCVCPTGAVTCGTAPNIWCCTGTDDNGLELVCGEGTTPDNRCISSDGLCSYDIGPQDHTKQADCSYRVSPQDHTKHANCSYRVNQQDHTKHANCSYRVHQQNHDKHANCSYRISIDPDTNVGSVTPEQPCAGNQFCYLLYGDDGCNGQVQPEDTGLMHGTCFEREVLGNHCEVSADNVLEEIQGCTGGKYCYLLYGDEDCTGQVQAGDDGIMFGTCFEREVLGNHCEVPAANVLEELQGCTGNKFCYLLYGDEDCTSQVQAGDDGIMYGTCFEREILGNHCEVPADNVLEEIQGCPNGRYCYLLYSNESCTGQVQSGDTGMMYGTCFERNILGNHCNVTADNVLTPTHECPNSQYCFLNWTSPACDTPIEAGTTGRVYGVCNAPNQNNTACPVPEE